MQLTSYEMPYDVAKNKELKSHSISYRYNTSTLLMY
jgi:hypothetical protein